MSRRVVIRAPVAGDEAEFLAACQRSRKLHSPWVSTVKTPAEFRAWLGRMVAPANYPLLICRADTGEIVGVVNVSNIVRGLFHSAYLGYYVFAGHEGQGLMREGLQAVMRHAFKTLKLHRLEANIQPGNKASLRLVMACGFAREGYSPRYLKIGGRWRDHERWAILADAKASTKVRVPK
ncbi:GNAT family N-acetyltransferase [Caenimonas koreensis]|uniref:GNAT family N-acetyltransferase n=1 Tax=Caenimonas koreensis TaxID=367474 RepID=UPI003783BE24